MHFTYLLYSPTTDTIYRGATRDLADRLRRHNARQEKATAPGAPWLLLWATSKPTRGEALRLERKLKNLNRSRLIDFLRKYTDELLPETAALLPDWPQPPDPTPDFHS